MGEEGVQRVCARSLRGEGSGVGGWARGGQGGRSRRPGPTPDAEAPPPPTNRRQGRHRKVMGTLSYAERAV